MGHRHPVQTSLSVRECCWLIAYPLTCYSSPVWPLLSLFLSLKRPCVSKDLEVWMYHLYFFFSPKVKWVDRFFLKLVLLPLNVSSISLPLKSRDFSYFSPVVSLVCRMVLGTKKAGSSKPPSSQTLPGLNLHGESLGGGYRGMYPFLSRQWFQRLWSS